MSHLRLILNQEALQTVTSALLTSCFGLLQCSLYGADLGNHSEAGPCPECSGLGKIGHVVICPHGHIAPRAVLLFFFVFLQFSYFKCKQLLNSLNKSGAKHSGRCVLSFCCFKGQLKQNCTCRHMVQKIENYLKNDLLVKIGFNDMQGDQICNIKYTVIVNR